MHSRFVCPCSCQRRRARDAAPAGFWIMFARLDTCRRVLLVLDASRCVRASGLEHAIALFQLHFAILPLLVSALHVSMSSSVREHSGCDLVSGTAPCKLRCVGRRTVQYTIIKIINNFILGCIVSQCRSESSARSSRTLAHRTSQSLSTRL